MPASRDPNIKKHSPVKLREFAYVFRKEAGRLRNQAAALDAKADRYLREAANRAPR